MARFQNIFSVDLEEWFVVEIFSDRFSPDEWHSLRSAVVEDSLRLLDILNRHDVRATWFVLGWCAEKYPELIQEIFQSGHEIACHSFYHRRVDRMDPAAFRRDTTMAIDRVVKAIGNRPYGYRAPSWSIMPSTTPWALEILGELGFLYDSSIFPIRHDLYGWPEGPRLIFKMDLKSGRSLYEIPATTYRLFGKNMPIAGGGHFRHAPYWYSKRIMQKLNARGQPVVFYVHPWEISASPPRLENLSLVQRFRTYGSTSIMKYKLDKLLEDFSFTTAADYLNLSRKRKIGFE